MARPAAPGRRPTGSTSHGPTAVVDVLTVARALADPTRLRIFRALREQERCVRDLVETEGVAQPLVSHHLRVLADAGLVESRSSDSFRLYALSPTGLNDALGVIEGLLDPEAVSELARPGGNSACCR